MKLATLNDGSRDGRLLIVSRDLTKAAYAVRAETMQSAIENWLVVQPELEQQYRLINEGLAEQVFDFKPEKMMAPLPRAYQFVDASAFLNHGNFMERAYDLDVKKEQGVPILLQRQGDDFKGACEDYVFPSAADNCDFEGEVAAIVDDVPMGKTAAQIEPHIKLFMLLNDVSMRTHLFRELSMGFGFIQAKPATVFAPVAVTPDELGKSWQDGRVQLDMNVHRNGEWFGNPNGREMDFSFGQLISHLSYNRNLKAGTVIASGTFSNKNYAEVGSACLAERRAIEVLENGKPTTPFIQYGERLRFEMFDTDGQSIFGAIDHQFVAGEALS
jgi:fumarylacetoacetate (FAA) hydrolase